MNTEPQKHEETIHFHCTKSNLGCGARFSSATYYTEDYPERTWLPYRYYADCPKCGAQANQANWELGHWKQYHDNGAMGASKPESRQKIANNNRNRDKSTYQISRFNAMTHGNTAATAEYYPARPGKYPECESCEYLLDGCGTEMKWCGKRIQFFLAHKIAIEQGDSAPIKKMVADFMGGYAAILSSMIRDIADRGVTIETPLTRIDKDKGIEVVKFKDKDGLDKIAVELESHPNLKFLNEMFTRYLNGLDKMGLNPAPKDEEAGFKGYLDDGDDDLDSIAEYEQTTQGQLSQLRALLGNDEPDVDPVSGGRMIEGTVKDA